MFYFNICYSTWRFQKLFLSAILISTLFFPAFSQTQQNKTRIGTFTKCEILLNTNIAGLPQYPKDTIITSGSSIKIPVKAEFDNTIFKGTFEIDFPQKTSLGTWTKGPSRITLEQVMASKVILTGNWDCSKSNATNYYSVNVFTATSSVDQPCSQSGQFTDGKVSAGTSSAIEAKGNCSFSLFDVNIPNYDFNPINKIFYTGCGFELTTASKRLTFTIKANMSFSFDRVTGPVIGVSASSLEFKSDPKGNSQTQKVTLSNAGSGQLDFNLDIFTNDGTKWLSVSPASGSIQEAKSIELNITVNPALLEKGGEYNGQITISAPNAANSPVIIKVLIRIEEKRLLLKFDPPKIKCSEWTTLEISVVDKNNNLVSDYEGGAEVRLLKSLSTDKITKLPELQSVLISKGKSQPIFIYTPEEPFRSDSAITNKTVLSGKIFIKVKLENSTIPPDTAKLTVYSPIDFFIDHIEVQQGVKDIDKNVSLEYKPGEKRTFTARNFIANHLTVVRAFVNYKKTVDIPFSRMDYGLFANLNIYKGDKVIGQFDMGSPGLTDPPSFSYVKDTFLLQERVELKDALFKRLNAAVFKESGYYEFNIGLFLPKLYQDELEIPNNKKTYRASFTGSKSFSVFGSLGCIDGEDYLYPDVQTYRFLNYTFPIEETKILISDPKLNKFIFKPDLFSFSFTYWNTLNHLLNRHNELSAPQDQKECILMFTTPGLMDKISNGALSATDKIYGKACVVRIGDYTSYWVAHELGHILGLKETVDAKVAFTSPLAPYFLNGDPNPRRSQVNEYGNWTEEGNINLLELKQAFGSNRYHDFMSAQEFAFSNWTDRVSWDHLYKQLVLNPLKKSFLNNQENEDGYIAISGAISENDLVVLNPIIKMTHVPVLNDTLKGNYAIEFYNFQDQKIASFGFDAVFLMPGIKETSTVPFSLYLPFQQAAKKIKIIKHLTGSNSKVLSEKVISDNKPEVQIISPVRGDRLTNNFAIKWSAKDKDGDALTYDISYSADGKTEKIIASNLTNTSINWNSALYEAFTNGSVTVIANDGVNDGRAKVDSLTNKDYTGISKKTVKEGFVLEQNYPNPLNSYTNIEFVLPQQSQVTLKIFNLSGVAIETVLDETLPAGHHQVQWFPESVPSGIYFYRLNAQGFAQTRKFIIQK